MNLRPRRSMRRVHAFVVALVTAQIVLFAQQPVFRSGASSVSVNVAVKKGSNPVANLSAADFQLSDNGVMQAISALSVEAIPIDVTLFIDTSGSTAGRLDDMKRDVQAIIRMLRSGDRFRLLTIGDAVYESVPWVAAGTTVEMPFRAVGGISLITDALTFAMLHKPDPDRRHLIVGMTDLADTGGVVSPAVFKDLAARSEAVIHLVKQSGGANTEDFRLREATLGRKDAPALLQAAAERTGGKWHGSLLGSASVLRAFTKIFEDFRQSYVLRYTPENVPGAGWHTLQVTVPSIKSATVHARAGYYGAE